MTFGCSFTMHHCALQPLLSQVEHPLAFTVNYMTPSDFIMQRACRTSISNVFCGVMCNTVGLNANGDELYLGFKYI